MLNTLTSYLYIIKKTAMNNYQYTKANNSKDLKQLVDLFNKVFSPEKVGELAQVLNDHFPDFKYPNWHVVKETETENIVSAFASIPWHWSFNGISLKVVELGILGTLEKHRNKRLFKNNNQQFIQELHEQDVDLAVIQGIPGIYHRLGYHYSIPMENHTEVPLNAIPDDFQLNIRKAEPDDVDFLIREEVKFSETFDISAVRKTEHWDYILSHGRKTEYGSRIFIINQDSQQYYIRVLDGGFGTGLTVSEASLLMPDKIQRTVLSYLKKEALKLGKPYLRLNLPNSHPLITTAKQYGASAKPSYAWQIKLVNTIQFIKKIKTVLERRIMNSSYAGLTGTCHLNCYQFQIIISWKNGAITEINNNSTEEATYTLSIPDSLLTQLLLGFRSWRELQYVHPDVFPADQYLRISTNHPSEQSGGFYDVLFPKLDNWINCEY